MEKYGSGLKTDSLYFLSTILEKNQGKAKVSRSELGPLQPHSKV